MHRPAFADSLDMFICALVSQKAEAPPLKSVNEISSARTCICMARKKQLRWSVCTLVRSEHKGERRSRNNLFKDEKVSRHYANAYRGLKGSLRKKGRTSLETGYGEER